MKFNAKLLFTVILICVMAFSVVGCTKTEAKPDPTPPPTTDPVLNPEDVLEAAAKAYFPKVAESNNMIASEEVHELLEANPNSLLIIDIRSAEDFEAGHITGAVHSPWPEVGQIIDRIPTNKPVVIACYTGQTSGQTVGVLRAIGFENVKSLTSGIRLGWTEKSGFELEGTGMVAASELSSVSSAATPEEEILWDAAKAYFPKVAASAEGNKLISGPDLHEALEANPKSFYVVDIRSADDFALKHIAGSVHSPWSKFGEMLDTLPTNLPIVVACYSGQTAGQTLGILRLMGYDAYSLAYGVHNGWEAKDGLPLVSN
ncbi:MAG: rhodanese-like domain-containing protein [Firmicutes bacterium]|nr:rhodanese-like domain-containing protein [Bacillota bacterium]